MKHRNFVTNLKFGASKEIATILGIVISEQIPLTLEVGLNTVHGE